MRRAILLLVSSSLAMGLACDDGEADCDGPRQLVCAWNADTRAYDRDCRMVCEGYRCPSGAPPQPQCLWNQAGCGNGAHHCEAAPTPPCSDGGTDIAFRNGYYSNDPRCAPRD